MGPVGSSSEQRSAVSSIRRRNRREWIVLTTSSGSSEAISIRSSGIDRDKQAMPEDFPSKANTHYRGMQDCFRQHPETYGDELADPGPDDENSENTGITEAVDSAVAGVAEDAPMSSVTDAVPLSQPSSSTIRSSADDSTRPPPSTTISPTSPSDGNIHPVHNTDDDDDSKTERVRSATAHVKEHHDDTGEGGDDLVPKEWHDTRKMNEEKSP